MDILSGWQIDGSAFCHMKASHQPLDFFVDLKDNSFMFFIADHLTNLDVVKMHFCKKQSYITSRFRNQYNTATTKP